MPRCGFGAGGFASPSALPRCLHPAPSLTVHLAFIREDDFPPAAGRVDRQRLLEALLDVWTPHALGIIVQTLVHTVLAIFPPLPGAAAGVPAVGRYGAGCSGLRPRAPTDTRQPAGRWGTPVRSLLGVRGCGDSVVPGVSAVLALSPLIPGAGSSIPVWSIRDTAGLSLGGRAMISMSTPKSKAQVTTQGPLKQSWARKRPGCCIICRRSAGMWCPWVTPQEGVAAELQPVSPDPAPPPKTTLSPPNIPVPPHLAKAEPGFEGRPWAAPGQSLS